MTSRAERGLLDLEGFLSLGLAAPTPQDDQDAGRVADAMAGYAGDIEQTCDELGLTLTMQLGFAIDDKLEQCSDCEHWDAPHAHVAGLCRGCRPSPYDTDA